jgi:hypothetical protein
MSRHTFQSNNWIEPACRGRHHGTSSLEVIVAFTLLSSVLAVSTPLIVRHQRLVTTQREYRFALDEVNNQLDRLSILPHDELPAAVERLTPSEFAVAHLANAKLHGQIQAADLGQRVTISISWGDEQRQAAPIILTSWFLPQLANANSVTGRRTSP